MSEIITSPLSLSSLATMTLQRVQPSIADQVYRSVVLYAKLKEHNRIKLIDGGETYVAPILIRKVSNTRWYAGFGELDITPQDNTRPSVWDWRQLAGTIAIDGLSESKNMGPSRIMSLLEYKFEEEVMGLINNVNTTLFTANAGNALLPFGIPDICEAAAQTAQTGTVGGIAKSATNADGTRYWENVFDNVQDSTRGGNTGAGNTFQDTGLNAMEYVFNTTAQGADMVDFIVTTIAGFSNYQQSLQPQQRFEVESTGDARFKNLQFGSAPVMFDVACPANRMYFLNTRWLELAVLSDKNFVISDPVRPVNGDAKYWNILWAGAFVCRNMFRQGVLINADTF